ncbi:MULTISPECIES: dUTP diphosphatase [unclassified Mesorhizobium]|uniref:dUTP diphosphatase n=1 Tax=unclassified Mesorhizobium TaxID=325217 RepID=UPI00333628D5
MAEFGYGEQLSSDGSLLPINVVVLPHAVGLPLPSYATEGSAGLDLRAAIGEDAVEIAPGERKLIPTGLIFELPVRYEGQIRSRSGLAYRNGVVVLNSPGTVDSDFRGEVLVLLFNHGKDAFNVRRGDRIAQFVVASCVPVRLRQAVAISATSRGLGGFGSTGDATGD